MYKLSNTKMTNDQKSQTSIKSSFFTIIDDMCFYSNGEELYIHLIDANFSLVRVVDSLKFPMKITKTNGYFFLINTSGKTFKLSITDYSIKDTFENLSDIINDKIAFCYEYKFEKFENQVGLYSIFEKKIVWFNNLVTHLYFIGNFCFGTNKNNLTKIDLKTGEHEWVLTLSDLGHWYNDFDKRWEEGQICHFVGVVDDILWLDVTAHVLLGIDIHTGQIKYNLKETVAINEFPEGFPIYKPHYGKTTFDQKQQKLWGMEGYSYWEVDLNETILNLKLWYMGDECESNFTSLPNFDICGINQDYIFFPMGGLGGNRKAQVAALNRRTLKIDWQYIFTSDVPYYTPTKVEVSEDHLFVLDSEGTLHIFEREKVA